MIRGVCFDMDGVLFDTERLGTRIMQEAAGLQGFSFAPEQWRSLIGKNMQDTKAAIRLWFGGSMDPDCFHADWCQLMLAHVRREGMPEKPGARKALEALKGRGIPLALATSNDGSVVETYLARSGFRPFFDQVVTGEMCAKGKPAPDIYLRAAQLLGLPPADCAGVEDSLNGVKALRAAGMQSIMVPDVLPYTPEMAPYVDVCLPSLEGLVETLLEKE